MKLPTQVQNTPRFLGLSTFNEKKTGANPTFASYNDSVVNFYNATGSLASFENKKYFLLL
jgi:hypothetical protein